MKPLLIDTGPIVAALDRDEEHHEVCRDALEQRQRPLVTCEAVIVESCYLLREIPGAPEAIIRNVELGVFRIPFLISQSAARVQRLITKYRDVPMDYADACLVCLAEEQHSADILTLDADFHVYRWGRNRTFHICLPGL